MSTLDVDIWHGSFRQLAPLIDRTSVLSSDERARGRQFARDELSLRWRVGRTALRLILARYDDRRLSVACDGAATDNAGASQRSDRIAADMQFAYGPHGKPTLRDGPNFSVSHTTDHLVIAICRTCPVGLDIEEPRHLDDWRDIARLVLTHDEQVRLAAIPAGSRATGLHSGSACVLAVWTRKEAFLKALGLGVTRHLKDVDMRLDPHCDDALSSARIDGVTAAGWRVGSIDIAGGHLIAALALGARMHPILHCHAIANLQEGQKAVS